MPRRGSAGSKNHLQPLVGQTPASPALTRTAGPPPRPPNAQPLPRAPAARSSADGRGVAGVIPWRAYAESSRDGGRGRLPASPRRAIHATETRSISPNFPSSDRVREPRGERRGRGVCARPEAAAAGASGCPRPRAPPRRTARMAQARGRLAPTALPLPLPLPHRCRAPGSRRRSPPRSAARCPPRGLQSFWVTCWPRGQHPVAKCAGGGRSEPDSDPRLGREQGRPSVRACGPANLCCEGGTARPGRDPRDAGQLISKSPGPGVAWAGPAPPPLRRGCFLTRREPRCAAELQKVDRILRPLFFLLKRLRERSSSTGIVRRE